MIHFKSAKRKRAKPFKVIAIILILISFILLCPTSNLFASAESGQTYAADSSQFEEEVNKQLDDLDFDSIDKLLAEFNNKELSLFGGSSFLDKIKKLITGDFDNGKSVWVNLISIFLDNLVGLIPIMSLIIAISLIGNMLQGLRPNSNEKSISNLINFVTYGFIVIIVLSIVTKMITVTTNTILSIKSQMETIFPLLLTFLSAVGGTVSTSVYQPAMALLSGAIMSIFTYVLLPIFIFSVVFSIVSNLSSSVKLEKFTSFFESTFKWITGLIFTIFTAFLSVQGLTASSIDGLSLRTVKYAIKSYVPMLGSYLSDGVGVILASSNLIKNAIGAAGLFMLLATILSPLIELVIFMLALKLIAGIIEPLGNKQVANFISSLSKSMVLLVVILIGIAFVYFIMIGLVMCSANLF